MPAICVYCKYLILTLVAILMKRPPFCLELHLWQPSQWRLTESDIIARSVGIRGFPASILQPQSSCACPPQQRSFQGLTACSCATHLPRWSWKDAKLMSNYTLFFYFPCEFEICCCFYRSFQITLLHYSRRAPLSASPPLPLFFVSNRSDCCIGGKRQHTTLEHIGLQPIQANTNSLYFVFIYWLLNNFGLCLSWAPSSLL